MLNTFLFKKHLQDDEALIRVVHKHWLLGMRALLWPTLFFAVVASLLAVSQTRGMVVLVAVLAVVIAVWWIRNFLDYFLDAWIITNHGIIDIEWFGWFHRHSARVLYSDLEGVSYEVKGVFPTLLRYGTISVEKISTGSAISLDYVSHPKSLEFLILQQMEQYLHTKNMKNSKHVQELLSTLVADHMHLREMK